MFGRESITPNPAKQVPGLARAAKATKGLLKDAS